MGSREQTQIEFHLIKTFAILVLDALWYCLPRDGNWKRWKDRKNKFEESLEEYEKDYI